MSALYFVIGFICFLCMFWGIWGSHYFLSNYRIGGVAEILPSDMSYVLFAVGLPILILLMIGLIIYVVVSLNQSRQIIANLLLAAKAEMSGIQTIGKNLIEVRQLGFTNQFFINLPVVLDDMSRFIANIILKSGIAEEASVSVALAQNDSETRLYSVCRIVLDKRETTPHFEESLRRLIKKDASLAGLISLFSQKYDKLLRSVDKYDLDGFMFSILEEGELGKVRNVLLNALSLNEEKRGEAFGRVFAGEDDSSLISTDLNVSPSED